MEEDEEDEEDEGILVLQSNGSKRVERWVENGGETFLLFQGNTYIFQEVEDFIHALQALVELLFHIVGLIER